MLGRILLAAMVTAVPASAEAASWATRTEAGMQTHVYRPDALSAVGDGRALLIVLHGCVQSGANLRDYGTFEGAADDTGTVVALPEVPGGGVIAGCWDYYGANHDRSSRHDDDLLALVDGLLADPELDVDPDQVYLAGLSSGAGQSAVMGCLAPDVFAGIGIAAGPAVGTTESEIAFVTTTAEAAAATCRGLAGAADGAFATQQVAVITGTMDYTVAQDYARINAETFSSVYAVGGDALESSPLDVTTLPGAMPQGTGTVYADATGERVTLVTMTGVGHAWPTGSGDGYELLFVSPQGFDFGRYLMEWFQAGNRRVDGGPAPTPSDDDDDDSADDDDDDVLDDAGEPETGSDDGDLLGETPGGEGCACHSGSSTAPRVAFLLGLMLAANRRRGRGQSAQQRKPVE